MSKALKDSGIEVPDSASEAEISQRLEICSWVQSYLKDVFECLTGARPHKMSISDEDLDSIVRQLVPQEGFMERVAANQRERSEKAYADMERCSTRKRADPYAFLYLAEHKSPLKLDGDFAIVESHLRSQFGDVIPDASPASTDFNFTFLEPVPLGMRIEFEEVDIAGIAHRKDEAMKFCHGSSQRLRLRREAANTHDRNAIQVIGCFQDRGLHHYLTLGYLPSKLAAAIVSKGKDDVADVLLNRIWVSSDEFVRVVCDIVLPIE